VKINMKIVFVCAILLVAACHAEFESDLFSEEMVQAWEPKDTLDTSLVQTEKHFGDRWLTQWRKITGHRTGDFKYRSAAALYKNKKFSAAAKYFIHARNLYEGMRNCKGKKRVCKVVNSKYCPQKCCLHSGLYKGLKTTVWLNKCRGGMKQVPASRCRSNDNYSATGKTGKKKGKKGKKKKKSKKKKKGKKKKAMEAMEAARKARALAAPAAMISVSENTGKRLCKRKVCRYTCPKKTVKHPRMVCSGKAWCETFHTCYMGDARNFWAWAKFQNYRRFKGACANKKGVYGKRHKFWGGKHTFAQCKAKCDKMGKACQGITMPTAIKCTMNAPKTPLIPEYERKAKAKVAKARKARRKGRAMEKLAKLKAAQKAAKALKKKELADKKARRKAKAARDAVKEKTAKAKATEKSNKVRAELTWKKNERAAKARAVEKRGKEKKKKRAAAEKSSKAKAKEVAAKKKAAELKAKENAKKRKERQDKVVAARKVRAEREAKQAKALRAREQKAKRHAAERNKKVKSERRSKNTCTLTAYEHNHYRGRVLSRVSTCTGERSYRMPRSGRRRGYMASSFRLSGGCRMVQLWDEDRCHKNYRDNVNIRSSVSSVKWDLNDDICGVTVWANRNGWCRL
jgi:hypothetical protein